MRKIIMLSTAAAFVVALASATLVAQRPGGQGTGGRTGVGDNQGPRRGGPGQFRGGGFGAGPGFGVLGRDLELTPEQRTKVRDIVTGSRDKAGPIADQLRLAQNELRRELFADTKNQSAISELSGKVAELRAQIADFRTSVSASIAELLTPEQREKVRAGAGRSPGMGRGAPGRGPGRGQSRGPARG
jgi:Spy/CpxP family protein refolding chaperone